MENGARGVLGHRAQQLAERMAQQRALDGAAILVLAIMERNALEKTRLSLAVT